MYSIAKVDEPKRLVFGYANVAVSKAGEALTDLQNERISPEVLEDAAYDYVLKFRDMGEMHDRGSTKGTVAKLVESFVVTPDKLQAMGLDRDAVPPRWWVGFKLPKESFEKVRSGEFSMFSIEGRADRREV